MFQLGALAVNWLPALPQNPALQEPSKAGNPQRARALHLELPGWTRGTQTAVTSLSYTERPVPCSGGSGRVGGQRNSPPALELSHQTTTAALCGPVASRATTFRSSLPRPSQSICRSSPKLRSREAVTVCWMRRSPGTKRGQVSGLGYGQGRGPQADGL